MGRSSSGEEVKRIPGGNEKKTEEKEGKKGGDRRRSGSLTNLGGRTGRRIERKGEGKLEGAPA